MVFLGFIVCALVVFIFTILLSDNADWIEKNTKVSGALIGFILASATSLPELVSSLTSVYLNQPELAISNILGSNLFNYSIVAFTNLLFLSYFALNYVKRKTTKITLYTGIVYIILTISVIVSKYTSISLPLGRISFATILIVICYVCSIKFLDSDDEPNTKTASSRAVKNILYKSVFYAIILIIASSALANFAEGIMIKSQISATLAGTVLLGASTSLPEFIGAINLMRKRAYDIAVSSVLASNLFNFLIFSIVDIFTPYKLITKITSSIFILMLTGLITTILMHITIRYIKVKSKVIYLLPSVLVIAIYATYLTVFSS